MFFLIILFLFACTSENNNFIVDNTLPELSIKDTSIVEGNMGISKFKFKVLLTREYLEPVTVDYLTVDATATEGVDYEHLSGTLNFSPPETIQNIEIKIISDEERENNEHFKIELINSINANLDQAVAQITIRNDDILSTNTNEGYTTPEYYEGRTLIWKDEFDNDTLDTNFWNYAIGDGCPDLCGWGNNELEFYTSRTENVRLENSNLIIEARNDNWENHIYTSARIDTKKKKTFQFGRIDIRAKLPEGEGIWPALWMLGSNIDEVGWPVSGEIDIVELLGFDPSTVHGTAHFGLPDPNNKSKGADFSIDSSNFSESFHVFSLIWEKDVLRWYVNDTIFHQITPTDLDGQTYPFNSDFFLIFNLAVGGNWPGPPDDTTIFPQQLIVDYVRVFSEK